MDEVSIAVVNESAMSAGAFKRLFQALAFQIGRDYNSSPWVKLGLAPPAKLVLDPTGATWTFSIVPHGNGELGEGWHEEGTDGSIKGFLNYGTTKALGGLVSLIASHELLEMLVDPSGRGTILNPDTGRTYKAEVCDPVYGTSYEVFGFHVSDFCQPAWFGIDDGLSFEWFTHENTVGAPGALGPHGYMEVEYPEEPGAWHSITA